MRTYQSALALLAQAFISRLSLTVDSPAVQLPCSTRLVTVTTYINSLLPAGRQLVLQLLRQALPINLLHVALGLLDFLFNLFHHTLDVVPTNLFDLVQDTLEILVLQVGEETVDAALGRGEFLIDEQSAGREDGLGEEAERVGSVALYGQRLSNHVRDMRGAQGRFVRPADTRNSKKRKDLHQQKKPS